ncbi:hypothetical protein [Rhizobium sp. UGM030330-04]|uniref:hypothetical protein n=1 Tax=Pseudomonadota TaxID=1224 RepID=UPI000BDC16FC|nr:MULTISPECIES: hypothetical protein [Pseudomonadota]PYG53444.1 hypothetical protein N434_04901 [Rhizobium sp. UGM030330-04]SNY78120.1 hypothetical protein SAMN02744784_04254 [Stenotrophomonas sp. CC120223-11]
MWPFEEKANDNLEEQIKLYNEIVDEKQEELDGLPEQGKSVAMDQHRADLEEQVRMAKLHIAQVKETAEREGRDVDNYDYDHGMFDD